MFSACKDTYRLHLTTILLSAGLIFDLKTSFFSMHDDMSPVLRVRPWPCAPLALTTLQVSLSLFGIGFTKHSSNARCALVPLIALCAWLSILSCAGHMPRRWGILFDGLNSMWLAQYMSTALVERRDYHYMHESDSKVSDRTKAHKRPSTDSVGSRLKFAAVRFFSLREIASRSPTETKIPNDLDQPPSSARFLLRTTISLTTCWLILDLFSLSTLAQPDSVLSSPDSIPLPRNPFSRHVSPEALLFRIASTIGFWFCARLVNQVRVDIAALATVALGLFDTESWPPLFGSVGDAYTLRRFWG